MQTRAKFIVVNESFVLAAGRDTNTELFIASIHFW